MQQRRALILYATMTQNTEKIARSFQEVLEHYKFQVTVFRLTPSADFQGMQEQLYFDDYDIICLGSPIVAGSPLGIVTSALSLGGNGGIDKVILDQKKKKGEEAAFDPSTPLFSWRRNPAPYPGVLNPNDSRPLGVVFSTYGGGFYGSDECLATLELLKLYLNLYSVDVVGKFACCGRESGPAGYDPGVKPKGGATPAAFRDKNAPDAPVCDAVTYADAEGNEFFGSYFFHFNMNSKPSQRDLWKAKAMMADLVEDYFFSFDGARKKSLSQYISLS